MLCPKCGKKIEDEWKNCPNCGNVLKEQEPIKNEQKQSLNSVKKPVKENGKKILKIVVSVIAFCCIWNAIEKSIDKKMDEKNPSEGYSVLSPEEGGIQITKIEENALSYDFEKDVQNGLLYSNENGKITDKEGNEILEYEDIVVQPNGVLSQGEVILDTYFIGAGGKIITENISEEQAEYSVMAESTKYQSVTGEELARNPAQFEGQAIKIESSFMILSNTILIPANSGYIEIQYNQAAVDEEGNSIGNVLTGDKGYVEGIFQPYVNVMDNTQLCIIADRIVLTNQSGKEEDTENTIREEASDAPLNSVSEENSIFAQDSGYEEYILPDSSNTILVPNDLKGLSIGDMQMAINEIYARHGRRFKDADIQAYFDGKSWYQGELGPEQFDESVLNKYERSNINTLSEMIDSRSGVESEELQPITDFAGEYYMETIDAGVSLLISVYTDVLYEDLQYGDAFADVEVGIRIGTGGMSWSNGCLLKNDMNEYAISGGNLDGAILKVIPDGVTISGTGGADGTYGLVEKYYS